MQTLTIAKVKARGYVGNLGDLHGISSEFPNDP